MTDHPVLSDLARALIRDKVRRIVRSSPFQRQDRPDLEQELVLRLLERWPQFDPGRGSEWSFVACVVESQGNSILRDRWCQQRDDHRVRSLHEPVGGSQNHADELADRVADPAAAREACRQQLGHDLTAVREQLPDHLRRLLDLLPSCSLAEIARREHCSRTTIYQRLLRLRKHCRKAGLREYLERLLPAAEQYGFRPSTT